MKTRARTVKSRPVLSAAVLVAAAGAAAADGPICDPHLPYTMPDLDQVRQAGMGVLGLPNNGTQYCVPTAAMNIIKYLTNHGYPALEPGSGPWLGSNAVYNLMTTAIEDMGDYMNTDPNGGTGGTNAFNGVTEWIEDAGLDGVIVVTTKGVSANDAPELGDLALAMFLDCPASISVGWYVESPTNVLTRNGGHSVAVTRTPNFCAAVRQISIRDPGNGGNAFTQQVGTTETYNIQTRNVTIMKDGSPVYTGPIERMVGYSSGHIDGYRIYSPAFGIAACNNPQNGSCVTQFMPDPSFTLQPQTTHFDPPGQAVLDLDILPSNLRLVSVVQLTPDGRQLVVTIKDGPGTQIPVPTPFSPVRVATGEDENRLYALDQAGAALHIIDWKPEDFGLSAVSLPAPGSALCFDDRNNQVVVLSAAQRRVIRISAATGAIVSNLPLPPSVVLGPEPRISICPVGAYLWLTSGTPVATGLMAGSAGLSVAASIRMDDAGAPPMLGVANDDRGHVFTFAGGSLVEFAPPAAAGGQWTQVASRFAPLASGPVFRIARSRSNLVPAIHDSPEWSLNVLPTQFGTPTPDCAADWDASGGVNSSDISAFLTSWLTSLGAPDLAADFNADGAVNSADVSAFLEMWLRNVQSGGC